MKTKFAFGKNGIDISAPAGFDCAVVESRSGAPLPDLAAALSNALDHPQGRRPLVELAQGKKKVAIVVCDITRPAPNSVTLPRCSTASTGPASIATESPSLIATGLHRAATEAGSELILGPDIANLQNRQQRCPGTWTASSPRNNQPRHSRLHPQRFRRCRSAHHPGLHRAAFDGGLFGRKAGRPGVAAEATIKAIHSPRFMREPLATEGSIAGNPLHAELLEIARMAHHDFILDVTLTRDRQISGVFAGDPVSAHAAGVRYLQESSLEQLDEPADLVITSAAGFPLDLTFYQSVKAITAAQHLLKPGGRILIVAECAEGVGSEEFAKKLRSLQSFETFLTETLYAPVEIDQWQLEELALASLASVLFFYTPGVKSEDLGLLRISTSPALKTPSQQQPQVFQMDREYFSFPRAPIPSHGFKSQLARAADRGLNNFQSEPRLEDGPTKYAARSRSRR